MSPLGGFGFSSGVPMTGEEVNLDFRLLAGDLLGVLAAVRGLSRLGCNSLRGDVRLCSENNKYCR